ncbi:MAG: regulatory protein RecX [Pseudomonadota bacterium]
MTLKHSVAVQNNKGERKPQKKREKRPPKKITEKYLYNSGLAYLQRFTASSAHFHKVMMRKIDRSCKHHVDQSREDCETLLQKTILKFQDLGLLDDTAYARGMVTSLRRRGLSSKAILFKLLQKGLSQDEILQALASIDADDENADITAGLRLARRKKIGPYRTRDKGEEKELAQLARSGFDYATSRKILSMDLDTAEDLINSQSF